MNPSIVDKAKIAGAGAVRTLNNFDFLRLLFASLVIFSHSPSLVDGNQSREILIQIFGTRSFGEVAVAGFFAISGYLITQSWEFSTGVVQFLKKRVLRIYPGFVVASLFTALVFGPVGALENTYFEQFDIWKFVQSVLILGRPATPPTSVGNESMWTIRFEFFCYLMVALFGALGLTRKRWLAPSLFLCIVAVLIFKRGVFVPYTVISFFLAGSYFYVARDSVRYTKRNALIAAVLLVVGMFHPILSWLALATAGAYLLFYFAFRPVPALQRLVGRTDVSYGTYLYAWPIQMMLIHWKPDISPWLVFAVALPLSLLCGWLSWHLVERPFLKLKKQGDKIQRAEKYNNEIAKT